MYVVSVCLFVCLFLGWLAFCRQYFIKLVENLCMHFHEIFWKGYALKQELLG